LRKRAVVTIAAIMATLALAGAPGASAATQVGDNCAANDVESVPFGVFEVAAPFNPLPTASPTAGVITRWSMTSAVPAPFSLPHVMRVVRQLGPEAALIVGETGPGAVFTGSNTFDTRIPVQAGDRVGLVSTNEFGMLLCQTPGQPAVLGIFDPAGTTGTTVGAGQLSGPELRIPVSAIVEPDADNDGFGDETQDKCPASAALQVACPVALLDSFALTKKGRVVVLIATNQATSVTVSGTATFPNPPRKRAGTSARAKLRSLTKVVQAGQITRFALNFPRKLKSSVASLQRGKVVTLRLTATAPNLAGPATTDRAQVKLRGRKKK